MAKKATKKAAKKPAAKKTATKKTATKKVAAKKPAAKKATKKVVAAPKKTTKKVAAKKTTKKTTKKASPTRKPNAAFMRPLKPSAALAAIVGTDSIPRTEIVKRLWAYIKKNKLQDPANRRNICADDKLKVVFNGKKVVSMFEMTKLVAAHVS